MCEINFNNNKISIPNDRDDPIWSMTQPGQDPHGYNTVTNHVNIVSYLAIDVNTEPSNQLINVSSRST